MAGTTEYKNNWQKENLDRISLTVPKGQKELIQAHAAIHDKSLNRFINQAIDETIARDQAHDALLKKAEALAAKLTSLGYETTVQGAIRLLEAFSVLEPVLPQIEREYLSKMFPKNMSPVKVIGRKREV